MALDSEYIKSQLAKAPGTFYQDIPILELTRDELIAVLIEGWEAEKSAREAAYRANMSHAETMKMVAHGR